MEIKDFNFVFQTDSDLVRIVFEKDNYIIEYNEQIIDKTYCAIYFSSNDIYFPNTEEAFRKRIDEKDFYEMYNSRVNYACKHIFLRDIKKQWYVGGINSRINSPELLVEFLKNETKGYSVIAIGSSAGGYAAVLYGSLLFAKMVFSFNGQFELNTLLITSSPEIDPLLFRNANSTIARYFDLRNFINTKIVIYYFTSLNSVWDNQQYKHIEDINSVKPIIFKTSHHGVPFVKSALPIIINMKSINLDKFIGKEFNPIFFSIKHGGLINTLTTLFRQLMLKHK